MKVLLTGFEPFGGNTTNVSSEVASTFSSNSIDGCEIVVAQLPVSFMRVRDELARLIERHQPNVILLLGQAGKREHISIERIAVNLMDSKMGDNDNFCPNEQSIITNAENVYFSNLPLKQIVENCRNKGIEMTISNTAGLYVCNCSFYHALNLCKELQLNTKIGFIHLPKVVDDEREADLIDCMRKAVAIAVGVAIMK